MNKYNNNNIYYIYDPWSIAYCAMVTRHLLATLVFWPRRFAEGPMNFRQTADEINIVWPATPVFRIVASAWVQPLPRQLPWVCPIQREQRVAKFYCSFFFT